MSAIPTILDTALFNFRQAADRLNIDKNLIDKLSDPKEVIKITDSPVLPSGRMLQFKAFIVLHNDALGPAKGGIRMSLLATPEDITGLAMEMTWKTSLIGVPFGGGKSGICVDPVLLSKADKEAVLRAFTRSARRHIGPEIYIPAPDMGTNDRDMGHIRDCISYSAGISITNGCFVTGKPVVLGGIVGRREATGKGVMYTICAACDKLGIDIKNSRVAIQGFGNVGSVAAEALTQAGAKIVGVSDVNGGTYNESGINIRELVQHVGRTGTVKDFSGGTAISNAGVLEMPCDILVPAATQSQITISNVDKIQAKIIAERRDGPTTPEADEVLKRRNIFVIPDILCNAGGVFVSYLEYTQETQREQMTLQEVELRLCERMKMRFNEVYEYSQKNLLTMRESAMDIAVGRVVEAVKARGFLP